jgi:putative transcription factor|tara:strand:+ start:898 stop:1308 length:411 start_codon:yes stop_codon:yes gene_type:complete
MTERCEVCGNIIRGPTDAIQIDGGLFRVCSLCSKLGKPAKIPQKLPSPRHIISKSEPINRIYEDDEVKLRRDFNKVIKLIREKKGISQEEMGKRINEKTSVIKHLETGTLKPNDILSRKIERFLKIQLSIPEEIEE